jgi:hypothetical protein
MTSAHSYRISPLAAPFVASVRRHLRDEAGRPLRVIRLASPAPCRFTLRQMPAGAEAILLSYSPFEAEHAYRETGPIFISAREDAGYAAVHQWPGEIDPRNRVFRAYNAAEEIVGARVGSADPEAIIAEFFSDPLVACIHVRALTYGCFTFKIVRA